MIAPGVRGGPSEARYQPAIIEQGRVVNVNVKDWSVDVVSSEVAGKFHLDVQVSSPYLHFVNGEGIYVMPEVGAMCWVCEPSSGLRSRPFILGFSAPVDERKDENGKIPGNYRAGRQNMNPGDIMLRTRDENFVILRRGGVVQIGATSLAQRLYIPVRNIIRDMCENYDLFSVAGEMTWAVDRTDQTTDGSAPTLFSLRAKNKANEPEHAAILTLGSHKDDDKLTLNLLINDSGATGAKQMVQLQITKEGNVTWALEKDFTLTARKNIHLTATEEAVIIEALAGEAILKAAKNFGITAGAQLVMKAAKEALLSASKLQVDAPADINGKVNLGTGAAHPVVLGDVLEEILDQLIDGLTNAGTPAGLLNPLPGSPMLFPGLLPLRAVLKQMQSQNTKTA